MEDSVFCSFRWTDTLIDLGKGRVHSCCKTPSFVVGGAEILEKDTEVFENSSYLKQRRQEMLDGVKHQDCDFCWSRSEKNIFHNRQKSTSQAEYFGGSKANLEGKTKILEIVLGNLCQMKCLYCGPEFSSTWESAEAGSGKPVTTNEDRLRLFKKAFFRFLPLRIQEIEELNFIGGEPLLQNDFFKILKIVSEQKRAQNQPLKVYVVTNLSVPGKYMTKFLDVLNELPQQVEIILSPSLDNTGPQAEFVREGLNWKRFNENLEMALVHKQLKCLRFVNTLNSLSVTGLSDFLRYCQGLREKWPEIELEIVANTVDQPRHFSPIVLDSRFVSYLEESLSLLESNQIFTSSSQQDLRSLVESLIPTISNERVDEKWIKARQDFRYWAGEQEKNRKVQFLNVFPEYREFLSEST